MEEFEIDLILENTKLSSSLWWIWRWKFEFVIEFLRMNIFGLDLIVILNEKHSIRAILTFFTNLTLCDSSLSIVFTFPCVSQFLWSSRQNNIIMDYWNCETNEFFMYCLLLFLYFLSIHCFVFILPISTILFVKFHSFVLLFIFFFSSSVKMTFLY